MLLPIFGTDAFLEPFGATPGMIGEWVGAVNDLLEGNDSEAAKKFVYNVPLGWGSLFGLDQDVRGFVRESLSGN